VEENKNGWWWVREYNGRAGTRGRNRIELLPPKTDPERGERIIGWVRHMPSPAAGCDATETSPRILLHVVALRPLAMVKTS
jgi:hypothetical protein